MMHCAPTTERITAPEFAAIYLDRVVKLHGLSDRIISDRDPRFTSKFWRELTKNLSSRLNLCSAYHPETDGQTERMNRTLEGVLRAYCADKQEQWDQCLSMAEFAINNAKSPTTGPIPFFFNYRCHPKTPAQLTTPRTQNAAAEDLATKMQSITEQAQKKMESAQEQQAKYTNLRRRELTFQVGDKLLLSTQNLAVDPRNTRKLTAKWWTRPFKITKKHSHYENEILHPACIHPAFTLQEGV
jgi:hypothetical protein